MSRGVLILERLQPLCVGYVHAVELGLLGVERRAADPMPAAHVRGLRPGFLLAQDPMICSSVNFDLFMVRSSRWAGL